MIVVTPRFVRGKIKSYLRIDFIHMSQDPHCPQCNSEYPYPSGDLWICPECAHEWSLSESEESASGLVVRDANGNLLQDGDSVTVIKDLPVKGFSKAIKVGTKVTNIRLVEGQHPFG
ncbi:MAG: hypothetical protein RIR98_1547 [Bacteroidota bacterium]